jgi:hypothetical protein
MMFGLPPATKIYIAVQAIDMRKGFEGLYGLVRDHLGQDPLSGHLFLFTNRTQTRLKALAWDGSGLKATSHVSGSASGGGLKPADFAFDCSRLEPEHEQAVSLGGR